MVVLLVFVVGCGAEYTAGHRTVHSTVPNEYRNATAQYPQDGAMDASITTHTITVLDRTGILLAVLGTAANAVEARRKAIKDARARGQTRGKVYYTYETTPVIPGFDFRLHYSWGGTTGFDTKLNGQPLSFANNDVEFSEMGMRIDYVSKRFRWLSGEWFFGVAWTPRLTSYRFKSTAADPLVITGRDLELDVMYFPAEIALGFLVNPRLRLSAGVEYDPVIGLIDAMGLDVFQSLGAHARADFMIKPWLFAYGRVDLLRGNSGSSGFARRVDQTQIGVGLSFQIPLGRKK